MTIELGILLTISSLLIALFGYKLNKQKHNTDQTNTAKEEASRDAVMTTKLDHIQKGVDEIRIDLKANERQMVAIGERVARVEESYKSIHKRVDKLEGKQNEN